MRILQPEVSRDTVRCLEGLLEAAKAGEVVGVAYAAIHRRRNFRVHICGEAYRAPVFARGCVAVLDDELGHRIRHEG